MSAAEQNNHLFDFDQMRADVLEVMAARNIGLQGVVEQTHVPMEQMHHFMKREGGLRTEAMFLICDWLTRFTGRVHTIATYQTMPFPDWAHERFTGVLDNMTVESARASIAAHEEALVMERSMLDGEVFNA